MINKKLRENPLRYIKDKEHAFAILAASNRHNNSDYEEMLEFAKEKALLGEIEYDEIQEWARMHCTYYDSYYDDDNNDDDYETYED